MSCVECVLITPGVKHQCPVCKEPICTRHLAKHHMAHRDKFSMLKLALKADAKRNDG